MTGEPCYVDTSNQTTVEGLKSSAHTVWQSRRPPQYLIDRLVKLQPCSGSGSELYKPYLASEEQWKPPKNEQRPKRGDPDYPKRHGCVWSNDELKVIEAFFSWCNGGHPTPIVQYVSWYLQRSMDAIKLKCHERWPGFSHWRCSCHV